MYDADLIESVLSHSDIVDVISSYITVIQKGKEYKAICPFHADTDPSLMISREKQIYKCFVCGEGGNAINFVRQYEKISFAEAVRKVAEISNFHDSRLDKQVEVKKVDPSLEPIFSCINDLQKYYLYALSIPDAENARNYLKERNISDDFIIKYGIGFSPIDGESTIKFLQAKGHSLKAIEGTGIALVGVNSKDHNAGRITFPLCDQYGQVVGFSARRIIQDDTGKYVNSPEGPIFHKSSILYNYHRAKDASRRAGYIYVLEGFMDVIALDKAGISNAVAIMGTALTNEQIQLLKRLNCEIRLCLDGDEPGQRAMMKVIASLRKASLNFRIVSNPNDLRDPDEILQQEGKEKLVEMLNNLVEPFKFQLSYYLNTKKLETIEDKKAVLSYFIPIISDIKDTIEKDDYISKLAKATGFESSTIYRELNKTNSNNSLKEEDFRFTSKVLEKSFVRTKFDKLYKAEQHILFYMLKEVDAIKFFEKNLTSFYNDQHELIANYILDYYEKKGQIASPSVLMGNIESNEEENATKLNDIISTLLLKENTWPKFSEKEVNAIAKVISAEKEKIYDYTRVNDSFIASDQKSKEESLKDYISRKRERLSNNKR